MNILVADGNDDVAQTLACMLHVLDHQSTVVLNYSDAMVAAETQAFDACIIDLDLPPFSGAKLLQSLRLTKSCASIRSVGWTTAEDVWRSQPSTRAFDVFLTKPVSIDVIAAALRSSLCPACSLPLNAAHHHSYCCWQWPP